MSSKICIGFHFLSIENTAQQMSGQRTGRLRYLDRPLRTPSCQKWGNSLCKILYLGFSGITRLLDTINEQRLLRAATNTFSFFSTCNTTYNRIGDSGDLQCRSIPHVDMGAHAMGPNPSPRCHHGILLYRHHYPLSIFTWQFIRLMMLFFFSSVISPLYHSSFS